MSKRVSGYTIMIKGFVPVDPKNLNSTISTAKAIQEAQENGEASGLVSMLHGLDVRAVFGSKDSDGIGAPPAFSLDTTQNAALNNPGQGNVDPPGTLGGAEIIGDDNNETADEPQDGDQGDEPANEPAEDEIPASSGRRRRAG